MTRFAVVLLVACHSSPPAPVGATAPPASVAHHPIGTGVSHTCVRDAEGKVWCWGSNEQGELGVTGADEHRRPVEVGGLPPVEGITAGAIASCAWTASGEVWCWGYLPGPGDYDGAPVLPTKLAGIDRVAEIQMGQTTACARRLDGSVACWTPVVKPERFIEATNVRGDQLAASDDVACVRAGGEVTCWNPTSTPAPQARPRLRGSISIAIDDEVVYSLRADRRVISEQPFVEETGAFSPSAVAPPDARAIVAGTSRVCAIGATVACWTVDHFEPSTFVEVPTLAGATDVSVGNTHACARTARGAVACWGDAEYVGDGRGYEVGPTAVPGLRDVAQIVVEHEATCIRRTNGTIACWGRRIGDSVDEPNAYFERPTEIAGIDDAIDFRVASYSGCARRRGGDVACWNTARPGPAEVTPVPAFAGATQLMLGTDSRCALVRDLVVCDRGKLFTPLPTGVQQTWVGFERLCARYRDGRVRCAHEKAPEADFGPDIATVGFGLLDTCAVSRRGTISCRFMPQAPVEVTGLPAPAIDMTSAHDQDCALLRDGRVACWKEPDNSGDPREAKLLPGITDAVEIAGDTFNGCVRHKAGTVSCWGVHAFVGDGLGGDVTTPVPLSLRL